jgi:hypothetical protein
MRSKHAGLDTELSAYMAGARQGLFSGTNQRDLLLHDATFQQLENLADREGIPSAHLVWNNDNADGLAGVSPVQAAINYG